MVKENGGDLKRLPLFLFVQPLSVNLPRAATVRTIDLTTEPILEEGHNLQVIIGIGAWQRPIGRALANCSYGLIVKCPVAGTFQ